MQLHKLLEECNLKNKNALDSHDLHNDDYENDKGNFSNCSHSNSILTP